MYLHLDTNSTNAKESTWASPKTLYTHTEQNGEAKNNSQLYQNHEHKITNTKPQTRNHDL